MAEKEGEEKEDPLVVLGKGLVPANYLRQGLEAGLGRRRAALRRLLEHRRLPEDGWDDATIEGVLYDLAMMDRLVVWSCGRVCGLAL
jgi:O-phospho-L-seryl-tRNASec:L-selenocysteinyl-tRNA synthase